MLSLVSRFSLLCIIYFASFTGMLRPPSAFAIKFHLDHHEHTVHNEYLQFLVHSGTCQNDWQYFIKRLEDAGRRTLLFSQATMTLWFSLFGSLLGDENNGEKRRLQSRWILVFDDNQKVGRQIEIWSFRSLSHLAGSLKYLGSSDNVFGRLVISLFNLFSYFL